MRTARRSRIDDKNVDVGDAEAAFAAAPVTVDATYLTPTQHHNQIELYATTAEWRDGKLCVNLPEPMGDRHSRSGWPPSSAFRPRTCMSRSPYIGGGFGGKATILPHTVLVAMAARRLGRAGQAGCPAGGGFTVTSFRPATRSRVRLAAERDGTLTAVMHEQAGQIAEIDHVAFAVTEVTARMYASPNIRVREATVATDVNTPGFQRAPAEAPGFFGFECAIDELACKLGMDPIELRHQERAGARPVKGAQWSSRR